MKFEWDPKKAAVNLEKHGVSFYEVQSCFLDPNGRETDDLAHSLTEKRIILIAKSEFDRLLYIVFTPRNSKIRIISARKCSPKEKAAYEKH